MKIEVRTEARTYPCDPPVPVDAQAVWARGLTCPCGAATEQGLRVFSHEAIEGYDTVEGTARCLACRALVGRLVVTFSTIFGLAEDRAVLQGRLRVY